MIFLLPDHVLLLLLLSTSHTAVYPACTLWMNNHQMNTPGTSDVKQGEKSINKSSRMICQCASTTPKQREPACTTVVSADKRTSNTHLPCLSHSPQVFLLVPGMYYQSLTVYTRHHLITGWGGTSAGSVPECPYRNARSSKEREQMPASCRPSLRDNSRHGAPVVYVHCTLPPGLPFFVVVKNRESLPPGARTALPAILTPDCSCCVYACDAKRFLLAM